mmetsp:Transcript_45025/g.118979  ORF Transcript_45025/g.118979 Transcript_45025/m.118979 type:complete len:273 (-) Transcript_45025:590-1408(-)
MSCNDLIVRHQAGLRGLLKAVRPRVQEDILIRSHIRAPVGALAPRHPRGYMVQQPSENHVVDDEALLLGWRHGLQGHLQHHPSPLQVHLLLQHPRQLVRQLVALKHLLVEDLVLLAELYLVLRPSVPAEGPHERVHVAGEAGPVWALLALADELGDVHAVFVLRGGIVEDVAQGEAGNGCEAVAEPAAFLLLGLHYGRVDHARVPWCNWEHCQPHPQLRTLPARPRLQRGLGIINERPQMHQPLPGRRHRGLFRWRRPRKPSQVGNAQGGHE